ncbi:MAG: DUF1232 domain-containing protein [Bacillota bacterium]
MNLRERAKKLKIDIPAVFIAMKHKETPFIAKVFAAITIVYALSPIDLIPDFIPVIGLLDDLIVLPFFITLTIKSIPTEQFMQYRKEAEDMWANGKPKKWIYAVPFVIIWILVIALVIKSCI